MILYASAGVGKKAYSGGQWFDQLADSLESSYPNLDWGNRRFIIPYAFRNVRRLSLEEISCNRAYAWSALKKRLALADYKGTNRGLVRFIRKLNPSLVIASWAPEDLILACRHHGVPIIEILHGHGYDTVPFGYGNKDGHMIPDGFVTFDRTSFSTFTQHFEASKHVIQLSKRELFSNEKEDPLFCEYDSESVPALSNSRPNILVTLSARKNVDGCGVSLEPEELIDPYLLALILQTSSRYAWQIRPHPCTLRQLRFRAQLRKLRQLARYLRGAADVSFRPEPLSSLARELKLHVTYASECAVELAEFGVNTMQLTEWLPPSPEVSFDDLAIAGTLRRTPYREVGLGLTCALESSVDPTWRSAYFEPRGRFDQMVFDLVGGSKNGQ